MFTKPNTTPAQQCINHGHACLDYAREALAEGRTSEAAEHVVAAELWFARSASE